MDTLASPAEPPPEARPKKPRVPPDASKFLQLPVESVRRIMLQSLEEETWIYQGAVTLVRLYAEQHIIALVESAAAISKSAGRTSILARDIDVAEKLYQHRGKN